MSTLRIHIRGVGGEARVIPVPPGISYGDVLPSVSVPVFPLTVDGNGRVVMRELTNVPFSLDATTPESWSFVG